MPEDGGLARVGRRHGHIGAQRRAAPIPVAPPRVPTPMPPPGEAEQKLAEQIWRPKKGTLKHHVPRCILAEQDKIPWINPRLIKHKNAESPWLETTNELHHSQHLEGEGRQKLGGGGKAEGNKRRLRFRWFGKDRSSSSGSDRGRSINPSVGERVCRRGLSVPSEDRKFTYYGFLEPHHQVEASIASQAVPPSVAAANKSCVSKCSVDKRVSGAWDSSVVPIQVNCGETVCGVERDVNVRTFKTAKREDVVDHKPKVPKRQVPISVDTNTKCDVPTIVEMKKMKSVMPVAATETKMNAVDKTSNDIGNEIVYENVKNIPILKPKEVKRLESTAASWKAPPVKFEATQRTKTRKANQEQVSRHPPEPLLMKNDAKIGFAISNSSLEDIYRAGVLNGSAYEDYSGIHRAFYTETKYTYAVAGVPGSMEQSSTAAAFFARAAQKLNLSSPHRRKRHAVSEDDPETSQGFFGALHRTPPPIPPALLRRIGVREVTGVGKVKVMLRVTGQPTPPDTPQFFSVDSRKKQVTLLDPSVCGAPPAPEDRRVGVNAPKMFAFDAIFTPEDCQTDVCANALTDVIHAVINGTDGCLFCFGHARLGKTGTMLGTADSSSTLGVIPCAISWLFRGIHEQKQKTGARFSVRVSAVQVLQPSHQLRDLLAGHANDCDQSPGVYLRDDPLFGSHLQNQSELRVPNAEKAAFYLDAALNTRLGKEEGRDSHFLYTLHVYQYSVAGKGGVAGGRSRLHLFDLGSCDKGKMGGSIPLSGLGNVLLAIFNGQKHLPYREHKITQLLKECLGSLTCHAAMIAHVSQTAANYTDTLTTVQLASRIHRMRRKKIKFGGPSAHAMTSTAADEVARQTTSTGSSDVDPSSSEQSADTVIYVGPAEDTATDGEHPPVYIPSLNSGDNRCAMGKALRGSSVEIRPSPARSKHGSPARSVGHKPLDGSPHKSKPGVHSAKSSPARTVRTAGKISSENKASHSAQATRHEEQWVDGPRISKQKVAEARNILLKEHIKKETWVDGPMQKSSSAAKTSSNNLANVNYGFMDSHKKTMIRKWVENQTVQLKQSLGSGKEHSGVERSSEPTEDKFKTLTTFKTVGEDAESKRGDAEGERSIEGASSEMGYHAIERDMAVVTVAKAVIKQTDDCLKEIQRGSAASVACGESSESSEEEKLPPPPAPLLLRYGPDSKMDVQSLSRLSLPEGMDEYEDEEIELEIVEVSEHDEPVPMQDSCLQVTEEDIAFCMGEGENPLPEVDQGNLEEHPLRVLSQENLTVASTFTDSLSNEPERCVQRPSYHGASSLYENPFASTNTFQHDDYIDVLTKSRLGAEPLEQLARLHQLYRSKLALTAADRNARCQSLSLTDMLTLGGELEPVSNGNCSIYSEPPYRLPDDPPSICNSCHQNIRPAESATRLDFSSLRHPDGASNPNLDEGQRVQRLPGNGASKSDYEEELPLRPTSKKRANSESRRNETSSLSRKHSHQSQREVLAEEHNEVVKLSEGVRLHQSSPSRRGGPTMQSKCKTVEEHDLAAKSAATGSPLPQKHLYLNKSCNEGYDSGHDSTTSPKTPKLPRARAQVQCESSGYESVVSFNSSLDSELGVKLIKDDAEEVHDPGGHSAGRQPQSGVDVGRPLAARHSASPRRFRGLRIHVPALKLLRYKR